MDSRAALVLIALCVPVASLPGCGSKGPRYGEVEGTVTLNGKPYRGVGVTFMPVPSAGSTGPSAMGVTDDQGRYKLQYTLIDGNPSDPKIGDGAVLGLNKVVVQDYYRISTHLPRPFRVPDAVGDVTTPLKEVEVKEGQQTFDFDVPAQLSHDQLAKLSADAKPAEQQ